MDPAVLIFQSTAPSSTPQQEATKNNQTSYFDQQQQKKSSIQTVGSRGASLAHPGLKAVDLAKVWRPPAWTSHFSLAQNSFLWHLSKHWTFQAALPLLAPLESWSLFSSISCHLFNIPLTCAFAKQGIVPLLIGRDLVSQEECVPARLSVTSLLRKSSVCLFFPLSIVRGVH